MKTKLFYLLLLPLLFTFQNCVTTQVASLDTISERLIPVYVTEKPDRPYRELKHIDAAGSVFHSNNKLLTRLAMRAKKEGADAVINVQFHYHFYVPYVTGIAIKYK